MDIKKMDEFHDRIVNIKDLIYDPGYFDDHRKIISELTKVKNDIIREVIKNQKDK